MKASRIIAIIVAAPFSTALPTLAQDAHPMLDSTVWLSVGEYFPERDFSASARGSLSRSARGIDFEKALGMKDAQQLGTIELGWQFGEKWGLAAQHFRSQRDASAQVEVPIEWQDVTFDLGIELQSRTYFDVTRFVVTRQFRDRGPHSLQLAAGFHYLDVGVRLAGDARLADDSVEFRRSVVSASAPVPNVGIWYRYSSSPRWLVSARADWLSASIGDISGRILNAAVSANYSLGEHFGIGLAYQFFELAGATHESNWRGDIASRFNGPNLQLSAFW